MNRGFETVSVFQSFPQVYLPSLLENIYYCPFYFSGIQVDSTLTSTQTPPLWKVTILGVSDGTYLKMEKREGEWNVKKKNVSAFIHTKHMSSMVVRLTSDTE